MVKSKLYFIHPVTNIPIGPYSTFTSVSNGVEAHLALEARRAQRASAREAKNAQNAKNTQARQAHRSQLLEERRARLAHTAGMTKEEKDAYAAAIRKVKYQEFQDNFIGPRKPKGRLPTKPRNNSPRFNGVMRTKLAHLTPEEKSARRAAIRHAKYHAFAESFVGPKRPQGRPWPDKT